jgi:hypothetical protein
VHDDGGNGDRHKFRAAILERSEQDCGSLAGLARLAVRSFDVACDSVAEHAIRRGILAGTQTLHYLDLTFDAGLLPASGAGGGTAAKRFGCAMIGTPGLPMSP